MWSVDRTQVYRWGLWPTWILIAVGYFSRNVVTIATPSGIDAGWTIKALQAGFKRQGAPRYLITDREGIFTILAFDKLLVSWKAKRRFGVVGSHGSISVTERMIWTLKHEWLRRVPLIGGSDHLRSLLQDFASYCNTWRPHMALGGATPDTSWSGQPWAIPDRSRKKIPENIELHRLVDVGITAYRLRQVA